MNKFFKHFIFCVVVLFLGFTVVSCEKDDNEEYYAGESAEDYKTATYDIVADWDFSGVSSLSSSEKSKLEADLNKQTSSSTVFNSRAAAVEAFDKFVTELKNDPEMKALAGAKLELKLKRDKAIIKSAKISW